MQTLPVIRRRQCTALLAVTVAVPALVAGEEASFSVAELFFELNHTDGDLGLHGKVDGEDWKRVEI